MTSPAFSSKAVLDLDPWLEPFVPAIEHKYNVFKQWKESILAHEGGYDKFTKGYEKFGFNILPDKSVVYREWAPDAKEAVLIGDFSKSPRACLGRLSMCWGLQMTGTGLAIQ
jgi:1,4-alpha-glucan branching enzyme